MTAVSIVLPVFNAARTVHRAACSILDQSLQDLELIVVDDGSTDDSLDVLSSIRDERLKLITCSHRGVVAAANTGTQHATAPIIARMDADDYSHRTRLQRQLDWLNTHDCDVVGCHVRILDQSGHAATTLARYERWINIETATPDQIAALRFVELPIVNPTIMARREYFELGFHNDEFPEDYDLMLRAAEQGMRFGKVTETLFNWYDSSSRITRNDARYSTEAFMNCRRHYFHSGPLHDVDVVDLWGVGQTGKPWLRWLQSKTIDVRRAFDVSPKKIGQAIHGVPVLAPDDLPDCDGTMIVVAVGAGGSRELITEHLLKRGYVIGQDAWFVA